jgi:hypothetical protein
LIKLRIDVDYPYPSRIRGFMYTALGIKTSKDYLKNSKMIAKMINESPKEVRAYWFFTPKTIPDRELMTLIDNPKHEVALHVVNDPYAELRMLEQATGKKIGYYTIHGTARLMARIMWRRWRASAPKIPPSFPPQSFHQFPTEGLDSLCYRYSAPQALKIAQERIGDGCALYFHPIWLFQRGKMNHRGPFYEPLKKILEVDTDLDDLAIRRKIFFRIARDTEEYRKDVTPTDRFVEKLGERRIDLFTFIERSWSHKIPNPPEPWTKTSENVGLLHVKNYDEWLEKIGEKTRIMIHRAEKSGIRVEPAEPSRELAGGILKIYNETPVRQGTRFSYYGAHLEDVEKIVLATKNCSYIGAYYGHELVGFTQLIHGHNIIMISQNLALQKHWDKAVESALVAKTVESSVNEQQEWIMYGRMGNNQPLDSFKQSNGFTRFQLTRYYIPTTGRGKVATKLGLHKEVVDTLLIE